MRDNSVQRSHAFTMIEVLVAAGVMGGEGIAGFSAGALTTVGLNYKTGAFILTSAFVVILLGSLRYLMKNPNKVVD